jgi:hypothetical protein
MLKQRLLRLTLALGILLSLGAPALPALAAGASISLSANKSTVPSGGTVVIDVYMNGGGNPINAVETDISYPSSKLQYVGFSATGSAFEISATNGGSDGLATVARGTTTPVTGSALVGTMTFKALVGSGSAAFGVAGSSSLVSGGNAITYGSSGTSVNFGAAAPVAAATKAATPAASVTPKDTTPPVITAVKATNVTPFSATITWTTNEPSDSAVDYGLDTTYGLSVSATALTTTHSVALSSAFLTPQTLLHYRVLSTDGSGNVATGTDQTLLLPGVTVTVVVRGPDGKPLPGATVTLDSATGVTDSKGSVTLPSSLGQKKVTTTYQGQTVQQPVTVTKTATPLPPVQLDLAKQPTNRWMLVSIGLFVVVVTLLAIDGLLFGSRLLARLTGITFRTPHLKPALATSPAATTTPAAEPTAAEPATAARPISDVTPVAPPVPVAAEPELVPVEPDLPQPTDSAETDTDDYNATDDPVDPEKTVAELMGEVPAAPTPPVDKPVEIKPPSDQAAQPIKISLQPPAPVMATAPELPSAPPDQAAAVAERLKKPTHSPVHHTHHAVAKKPAAAKKQIKISD